MLHKRAQQLSEQEHRLPSPEQQGDTSVEETVLPYDEELAHALMIVEVEVPTHKVPRHERSSTPQLRGE